MGPLKRVEGWRQDPQLADLVRMIDEFGVAVRHVGAGPSGPGFSYTVGLSEVGHPEVITVGLPREAAHTFLNEVAYDVHRGRRFEHGEVARDLTDGDAPIVFVQVVEDDGLSAVVEIYGRVEALQLIWSDSKGRLPWEEGFANTADAQPLLGPRD